MLRSCYIQYDSCKLKRLGKQRPIATMDAKKQRSVCTLSHTDCVQLVQAHVPDPCVNEDWKKMSIEELCIKYVLFLIACVPYTTRLSKNVLQKAMGALFELSTEDCNTWGGKVAKAYATCRRSVDFWTTGANIPEARRRVVEAMLKAGHGSKPMSPSPSPSCSPSPCAVRVKQEQMETATAASIWRARSSAAAASSSSSSSWQHASSEVNQALGICSVKEEPVIKTEPAETGKVVPPQPALQSALANDAQVALVALLPLTVIKPSLII